LIREASLAEVPEAKVGVFVGNASDPQDAKKRRGSISRDRLPETRGLLVWARRRKARLGHRSELFQVAGGVVLVLFDEVLNYLNRHRAMADSFHAFIQNLTVATTGTTRAAAVISSPRSQVEMTESDQQWQDRITKTGIKGVKYGVC